MPTLNINRISNGWIVSISVPGKGQSSLFFANEEQVLAEVTNCMKDIDLAIKQQMQPPASPEN